MDNVERLFIVTIVLSITFFIATGIYVLLEQELFSLISAFVGIVFWVVGGSLGAWLLTEDW